jgi:hypothetical protein
MTIPKLMTAAFGLCALLVLGGSSAAHHSFAAEFDANNCRDFTGTLTKIDWQNPHAWFYVDIRDAAGKVENWSFQTYSLITLKRSGTELSDFQKNIGRTVTLRGCLARNGTPNKAAAGTLKFEDGKVRQVGQLQD